MVRSLRVQKGGGEHQQRIVTELRRAAVCSSPVRAQSEPQRATVTDDDFVVRGPRHDDCPHIEVGESVCGGSRAQAADFFVSGEQEGTPGPVRAGLKDCHQRRSQSTFHIAGTPTEELAVLDHTGRRGIAPLLGPLDGHGVHMTDEEHSGAWGGSQCQQIARRLLRIGPEIESRLAQKAFCYLKNRGLARAAAWATDLHELLGERHRVKTRSLYCCGGCPDRSGDRHDDASVGRAAA